MKWTPCIKLTLTHLTVFAFLWCKRISVKKNHASSDFIILIVLTQTHPLGSWRLLQSILSGISVSGYINLEMAKAAGADMTDALSKCDADTPNSM